MFSIPDHRVYSHHSSEQSITRDVLFAITAAVAN